MGTLEIILVVLLLLWAIGFFGGVVLTGNLLHVLLAVALVVLIVRLLQGRKVL